MTAPAVPTMRALALDLETSGVRHNEDRIVTACAAIVDGTTVSYQREWLIAVDIDIPAEATEIHGITTEHARAHGRPASVVLPEIVKAIRYALSNGIPIVAYNATFDLTFVDREARRWMERTLPDACAQPIAPVIDPLVIWREMDRYRRGTRTLVDACAEFGIDLGDKAHDATADAIAAAQVAMAMASKFPRLRRMPLDYLHEAQVGWRREQCDSLRARFNKLGKTHDGVPSGWPMLPFEPQGELL